MEFNPDLIRTLKTAKRIAALTGAGISAESGVPTFRDAQTGLWARFDPEELATPEAYRRDSRLVWEWYTWRRQLISKAQPNPGHFALAELEELVPQMTLITQNIDGLHRLAGSCNVIELHGNINRNKCFEEGSLVDSWQETGEVPPRCPHCGGKLRPDVVWFGESLPQEALESTMAAARSCEVFLSIGTSSVVQPAASLPLIALEQGAVLVEINPEETPLTQWTTYVLRGPSGEVLPSLIAAVWKNP
jgi:NAD-dependent deacetylase